MPFSRKQAFVLTWWANPQYGKYDAVIADGAIRSGKTLIMSLSYVIWAMTTFSDCNFGMSGKTVGSFKRNVWVLLKVMLISRGYKVTKHRDTGDNAYIVTKGKVSNYFYLFGGRDERSQDLVQGFTAAGFFFDEVALMPRSFVEQAIGRCSMEGAKLWFNCNPEGPFHWFKLEWIDKLKAKNAIRLHFDLNDNPSLSEDTKEKYRRRFTGVFFQRFILGLWVLAEGIIYSMFEQRMIIDRVPLSVVINKKWIGIDYGQSNATVFLLIGLGNDDKLYILDEYFHEGKTDNVQKSPSKYSKDYFKWLKHNGTKAEDEKTGEMILYPVRKEYTFIDPAAKSFMIQLYEDGEPGIRSAINDVVEGIELISSIIDNDMLRILKHCEHTIGEFSSYSWDPKAQERGEDKPIKQNDHCMDALRYVVNGTRKIWQLLIIKNSKQKAA